MYFTAFGRWYYWLAMTFMFFANQFSSLSIDLWIREWSNSYHEEKINTAKVSLWPPVSRLNGLFLQKSNNLPVDFISPKSTWNTVYSISTRKVDTRYYLSMYAILATVFMIIKAFRMGLLFRGSLSASQDLHSRLLASITRASFRFYDSTPFVQMVNRFSGTLKSLTRSWLLYYLAFSMRPSRHLLSGFSFPLSHHSSLYLESLSLLYTLSLQSSTSTPRETSNESSHFNEARYTNNSTRHSLASSPLGLMVMRTDSFKKPWRGLTIILAPFSTSGLPMHGCRSVWMSRAP